MSRPTCCKASECKITVIFARVGESEFYPQNIFCGWADINLSSSGESEAVTAGRLIREAGYTFDIVFTSALTRAQQALDRILKEIGQSDIKVEKSWKLNERHYGALTGLNKQDAINEYDEARVKEWRTSYNIPPPPMEPGHPYYKQIVEDSWYAKDSKEELPKAESLKMAFDRVAVFWKEAVAPRLKEGKRVLVVAHGNALRGFVQYLDKLSEHDIVNIYLPREVPFYYIIDRNLNPTPNGNLHFLGDKETVKRALEEMHNQVHIN